MRLHRANSHAPEAVVEGASRAMRISMNRELENLETHIPFLGTVGSISPYIGLFGTVWGIMHAFIALGAVKTSNTANGCARYRRSVDCDGNWSVRRNSGGNGL